MSRKLLRFSTILAVPAIGLGLWLWLGWGVGRGAGWLHAKLTAVLLTLVYHAYCAKVLRSFEAQDNRRTHVWFRWFNEVPLLFFVVAVVLAVVKPF
jgi:putative membrane protein